MNADEWGELFERVADADDAVEGEATDEADVRTALEGCRDGR